VKKWLAAVLAVVAAACGAPSSTSTSETASVAEPAAVGSAADAAAANVAASASATAAATPPSAPAPRDREVMLASGTALQLDLRSTVASDTSQVEDAVRATLRRPVVVGGETILPAGAELAGVVTGVERAGRVQGRARVAYRFTSVRVDGERYDIETAPISHLAPATKGEDATKIAIGAGAGAAVGALLGGGDGAAKGAAIGGASGTGVVLATRGREVRLGPGANITTRLSAPAMIRVPRG
jgi:hypothetical protein